MAYCVKCGVELAATEKKCPLCGTKVILPDGMEEKNASTMYPVHVPSLHMEFRELLPALAVLLLLPSVICLICDFLISHKLTWSLFVVSSTLLAYAYIFPPFLYKKSRGILYIISCTAATCVFLFFISVITTAPKAWFLPLALPITLSVGGLTLAVIMLCEHVFPSKLVRAAVVFFALAVLTVLINIFVNLFYGFETLISWSLYSLAACVIIGVALILLNRSFTLKSEAKRRFFI